MNLKPYLFLLFTLVLSSCEYRKFDPTICDACDNGKDCIDGFCVCDPQKYYAMGEYCVKRTSTDYFTRQTDTSCLGKSVVLDSGEYAYLLKWEVDAYQVTYTNLEGEYHPKADGDSIALHASYPFYTKKN